MPEEGGIVLSTRDDNGKVSLAVFDIDGTVIDGQSPVLMVFNLMKQRNFPIRTAVRAGIWGLKYKAGIATPAQISKEPLAQKETDVRMDVVIACKELY